MTVSWNAVADRGGLAVITGGASGVGFEAARRLAADGFELLLVDVAAEPLERAAAVIASDGGRVQTHIADVSDATAVDALADRAFDIGEVAVVMNNAGISEWTTSWGERQALDRILAVNFIGVLNGMQSFVPCMIEASRPAAVINTGSKQGITTPPGNPAYNVSKAAVKVLTEQLAHELRQAGAPISAHLFVPGFTYTGMIAAHVAEKPAAAWTSEQTVAYLFERVAAGSFYILCPDNAVTPAIDARRVMWTAGDLAQDRPALSRWHPDWSEAFARFEAGED